MKHSRDFSILLIILCCINLNFAAVAQEPTFTEVMPELFSVAGSLSNAWADIDGDGDSDLAVSIKGGEIRLYINDEGLFKNMGATFGLPSSGDEIRGLSWGDYDNDGDLDLATGNGFGGSDPAPNRFYVNQGDGTFVDMASSFNVASTSISATAAAQVCNIARS